MENRVRGMMIAGIPGIVLLSAWLWTARPGISEENRRIYEEAVGLQDQVDTLGFQGFCLSDYPVAMYDGKSEYVFGNGEVQKRSPVLETFAGTVWPVGDHFEVIVPTVEQFGQLMSLTGGVEGMAAGSGYGPSEQKASIWHEAFHAYQLTDFAVLGEKVTAEDLQAELSDHKGAEEKSEEQWIVEEVDEKPDLKKKLEGEMRLLKKAACDSDIDELHRTILEYRECRRQRMEEMPAEAREAEIRCELTEGTAYYVESAVFRMASGGQAFEERYLEGLDRYENGRGKYYRTGFAKCMILDRLDSHWKETFDFSKGLDEAMASEIRLWSKKSDRKESAEYGSQSDRLPDSGGR